MLPLLAACTTGIAARDGGPPPAAADDSLPVIEHRVTSWGRTTGSLTITPDGWMVRRNFDFNSRAETSSARTRLTPEALRTAVAAIEPLRSVRPRSIHCANVPTDGPYGHFTWNGSNEYAIYYACSSQFPELAEAEGLFWDIVTEAERGILAGDE